MEGDKEKEYTYTGPRIEETWSRGAASVTDYALLIEEAMQEIVDLVMADRVESDH